MQLLWQPTPCWPLWLVGLAAGFLDFPAAALVFSSPTIPCPAWLRPVSAFPVALAARPLAGMFLAA